MLFASLRPKNGGLTSWQRSLQEWGVFNAQHRKRVRSRTSVVTSVVRGEEQSSVSARSSGIAGAPRFRALEPNVEAVLIAQASAHRLEDGFEHSKNSPETCLCCCSRTSRVASRRDLRAALVSSPLQPLQPNQNPRLITPSATFADSSVVKGRTAVTTDLSGGHPRSRVAEAGQLSSCSWHASLRCFFFLQDVGRRRRTKHPHRNRRVHLLVEQHRSTYRSRTCPNRRRTTSLKIRICPVLWQLRDPSADQANAAILVAYLRTEHEL